GRGRRAARGRSPRRRRGGRGRSPAQRRARAPLRSPPAGGAFARGDLRNILQTMKRAAALAGIRSLCSLGLPGEQLIPALLESLHAYVPSSRNLFDWTDAHGNLVRYYFEGPIDAEVARHYFEEFHNKREAEAMPAFRQAVMGRAVIRGAAEVAHARFYRAALYNEIWRPQGLHSRIEAIVHGARGKPLGSLVLYRDLGELAFTAAEERLLADVVPYIAR